MGGARRRHEAAGRRYGEGGAEAVAPLISAKGPAPGQAGRILVTGATGYIGGRLIPCLLDEGYHVRAFVRDSARLQGRPWADAVECVEGDVLEPETLPAALAGVETAYYLIHSLGTKKEGFASRDRRAADNFAEAAAKAGVGRIIYLGGIRPKNERTSAHLESRLETGERLRAGRVPVTEFRAGVVVGSGSLSFELIRYLTERLPVLITPRWVRTPTQPIAVRNVLEYLLAALREPESVGRIFEIGGAATLTYADMFRIYARVRGLRRWLIDVPVLTPRLSSLWVGLVTPLNARLARPLIEGLDSEATVHDERARGLFDVDLLDYETAVRLALERSASDTVDTAWSGALSSGAADGQMAEALVDEEGLIKERLQVRVEAPPSAVFEEVSGLGGDTGWLYADALWAIRGFMDMLVGGIGLRRTRRSYSRLRPGDTVDFFRVEAVEPDRLLRLRAEMKVPGRAWLQYELQPEGGGTLLTQTAFFEPKGLSGFLYWYVFYLPHRFIFPGLLRQLKRRSEA